MAINVDTITALSREVIRQHGRALDVATVTTTGGDSQRVEILVTVTGCHKDPCRFMVNVSRAGSEEFDREFRIKLNDALLKHAEVR
jgi:hypothetical protein